MSKVWQFHWPRRWQAPERADHRNSRFWSRAADLEAKWKRWQQLPTRTRPPVTLGNTSDAGTQIGFDPRSSCERLRRDSRPRGPRTAQKLGARAGWWRGSERVGDRKGESSLPRSSEMKDFRSFGFRNIPSRDGIPAIERFPAVNSISSWSFTKNSQHSTLLDSLVKSCFNSTRFDSARTHWSLKINLPIIWCRWVRR